MKKILTVTFLLTISLFFSGCGEKQDTGPVFFNFSKSIWKSSDNGTSWQVKNKGEGKANIKDVEILSLAISPYDGNTVYAGLKKGGILKTTDGGDNWKFINFTEKVYGLALDPVDGKTLYASGVWQGKGKIFKTEDDGINWKELYTTPSQGPIVLSIIIDKKNPSIIYFTTTEKEIIKSSDGGNSWQNIYSADAPIVKMTLDGTDNNLIYFITDKGGIYRSKNKGDSFEKINEKIKKSNLSIGQGNFGVLKINPLEANSIYLAGSSGIIASKDSGETWKEIVTLNNPQKLPVRVLAINPKNSNEIIYGMGETLYKSVDGGINWKTYQFDNKMKMNILEYDLLESNLLYLGFVKISK